MSKYSNTIEYNIKTNLDASGIQKLQAELTAVQNALRTKSVLPGTSLTKQIDPAIKAVQKLKDILNNSFNSRLGMLDLTQFNKQLSTSKGLAQELNAAFKMAGAQGSIAANNLVGRMYKLDTGLKSVSSTTDKIINTFGNTFRWGLIASAFATIMNSVHEAGQYVGELDKSLTNIMMVTRQSKEEMNEFAKQANDVAITLGATTTQITEATKVFAQQGMDTNQSLKMAEYSVHLANISEQDSATTADELTAMKNAFKINIDDMGNSISKWAAIANKTAVDMEELSVASQKAAAVADTVGVSMDQFAGHIAAIEATTREAPENIGNGLKTLYSRLADVKQGETLEDGVDLGKMTEAVEKTGVAVLDSQGKMREVGQILEDLMDRWGDLDMTQRSAAANAIAGRFQLARFEALMNSRDIYETAVNAAENEQGTDTYDMMQKTYRDSMEGRMNALTASIEKVFNNIFTTDNFYGFIDGANAFVEQINNLVESIGGGSQAVSAFGLVLGQVFNTQLARGVNNFFQNREIESMNRSNLQAIQDRSRQVLAQGSGFGTESAKRLDTAFAQMGELAPSMSQEQLEGFEKIMKAMTEDVNNLVKAEEELAMATDEIRGRWEAMIPAEESLEQGLRNLREGSVQATISIADIDMGLTRFESILKDTSLSAEEQAEALRAAFDKTASAAKQLSNSSISQKLNPEQVEKMNRVLSKMGQELAKVESGEKSAGKAIQNFQAILQDGALTTKDFTAALEEMQIALEKDSQAFYQSANNVEVHATALEHDTQAANGLAETVKRQDAIESVTNLAMGIGQLAFAWHSLQSLGSIWSNEDLELGDKVIQTIMNLGFTIPMITMGITQAAEGFKMLSAAMKEFSLTEGLVTLAAKLFTASQEAKMGATTQAAMAEAAESVANAEGAAVATGAAAADATEAGAKIGLWTATKTATAALWEFVTAEIATLGPAALLVAAIAGVAIAVGNAQQQWENYKKSVDEHLESSNEIISNIDQTKKSYDELYETYSQTGVATDELKDSAAQMAETLGIQGAAAKIARGEFSELNQQIQDLTNSQLAYNSVQASQKQRILETEIAPMTAPTVGENGYIIDGGYTGGSAKSTVLEKVQEFEKLQEKIDECRQQMTELNEEGGLKYDNKDLDNQIKALELEQEKYALTEKEKEWVELQEQKANNTFSQDLNDNIFDSLADVSQIKQVFDKQANIFDQYQYLLETKGKEQADAWYDGMIAEIAERTSNNDLKDMIDKYFKVGEEDIGIQPGLMAEQSYKDSNALGESALSSIGATTGKDEEKQAQINAFYEQTRQNILSTSETLQKEQEALESNEEAWNNQIEKLLKEKNSLEAVKTPTEAMKKRLGEIDHELGSLNKDLQANDKNLKAFDSRLNDIVTQQLNVDAGIRALVDGFEDWDKVLSDSTASAGQQFQAFDELAGVLSEISGQDASHFDASFIRENLDLIREAATGDVEALNELNMALQQKYLLDAGLTNEAGMLPIEIQNLLAEAQAIANDDSIEIGTALDPGPVLAGFQTLVDSGKYTAQQIEAMLSALSGLGLVPNIEYDTAEIQASVQAAMAEAGGEGVAGIVNKISAGVQAAKAAIQFPKLTGFTKTGSWSDTSVANAGTGSGGGSKSGGGGGGGSKGKEPSKVSRSAPQNAEIDLYNKVNAMLEKTKDNYESLEKVRSNSYGRKYFEYTNKEIDNLKQQIKLTEKSKKISEAYAKSLRTGKNNKKYGIDVSGYQDDLKDVGLKTDADGNITNYQKVFTKYKNKADKKQKEADDYWKSKGGKMDKYGNTTTEATMTEDEKKKYDNMVKSANQYYDLAKATTDIANNYNDALDAARDKENEIQDMLQNIIDLQVESFNVTTDAIKALDDLNKRAAKWSSFMSAGKTGYRSDSPFRALIEDSESLAGNLESLMGNDYFDKQIAAAEKDGNTKAAEYWKKLKKNTPVTGDGTSGIDMWTNQLEYLMSDEGKALYTAKVDGEEKFDEDAWNKAIEEMYGTVEDYVLQTEQDIESMTDHIIAAYGAVDEKFQRHLKKYDELTAKLEYQNQLVELTEGKSNMKALTDNLEARLNTIQSQAEKDNAYLTMMQNQLAKAQADYAANATENNRLIVQQLEDQVSEANERIQQDVLDGIDLIKQKADLAVDASIRNLQTKILGVKMDQFTQSWELAAAAAEGYKDSVESGYEIDKLRAKYQKMLDNASTLKVQNQIKQSMKEQLAYLEGQTKMSQFDVDLANAKLELLQKQIALEDAQRNKNQMRLHRDSQGNYNYVYTANDEDVADAEQEVLDAGYNIYEMSKEEVVRIQEEKLALLQDLANRTQAIYDNQYLTEEEKNKMLDELRQSFTERWMQLTEDVTDAQQGTIDGAQIMFKYAADDTKHYYQEMADATLETWSEAAEGVGIVFDDALLKGKITNEDFKNDVKAMTEDVKTQLKAIANAANTMTQNLSNSFKKDTQVIKTTTNAITNLNTEWTTLNATINDDLGAIDTATEKLQNYQNELNNTQSEISRLNADLQAAKKQAADYEAEKNNYARQVENLEAGRDKNDNGNSGKGNGKGNGSGGSGGGSSNNSGKAEGVAAAIWIYGSASGWGNDPERARKLKEKGVTNAQSIINKKGPSGELYNKWYGKNLKPYYYGSFDTGGYTGSWGHEGKMAILHEKELVLNKQDTENMLAAVSLVRGIVSAIGSATVPSTLGTTNAVPGSGDTIEQRVDITAEFPNATNADDIKSAILSLADNAYQYAYKTR